MKAEEHVHKYLDLSTSHLTEEEADGVECNDLVVTRPHDYGFEVLVPSLVDGDDDDKKRNEELRERFPNLAVVLDLARGLGCRWVNFDRDAECIDDLPNFEW